METWCQVPDNRPTEDGTARKLIAPGLLEHGDYSYIQGGKRVPSVRLTPAGRVYLKLIRKP